MNVKDALTGQLMAALRTLEIRLPTSPFNDMSTMEIDYATEILRAWKRVCEGTSPAAIRSIQYWGSLYCAARLDRGTDPYANLVANPSTEFDRLCSDAG